MKIKNIFYGLLSFFYVSSIKAAEVSSAISEADKVDIAVASDFRTAITGFLNYFLGFLGLLAVIMLIYAGITFITANGEEDAIKKARSMILWSVVGIVVIMLSFAIVRVVMNAGGAVA